MTIKKKTKKFAWEKKSKISKPKKTDFVKKEKKKGVYKQKKPTNKNAKKKFVQPRTVFGWEDREYISKPKASDFREPKKKPLKWSIPWLKSLISPEKIDEPKREDFVEKEERKVGQPIITAREVLIEKKEITTEKRVIQENRKFEEEPEKVEEIGILPKIMLIIIGICYLIFLGILSTAFINITIEDYLFIESAFFTLSVISIILAAIYSFKKEIFKGFIYISLILLIYIILGAIFAEPLLKTLNILLIVLAILPIQVYLVFYVK
ncbi:MAG TPA: hypothetical protein PKK60_03140 [archaeon]|nr:hypothetical protein [archaeon]